MIYFFDTSALVKRYRIEPGTDFVDKIFSGADLEILISAISIVELTSALDRQFRKGELQKEGLNQAIQLFEEEAYSERIKMVDITPDQIIHSSALILKHHLSSNDALILTTALELKGYNFFFVSSDHFQLNIAVIEGLSTIDPLSPPPKVSIS